VLAGSEATVSRSFFSNVHFSTYPWPARAYSTQTRRRLFSFLHTLA